MKTPKYVDKLLKQRTKLADKLNDVSYELDQWLLKKNIYPPDEDWMGGVELYANPSASERAIRKAIEENENRNNKRRSN